MPETPDVEPWLMGPPKQVCLLVEILLFGKWNSPSSLSARRFVFRLSSPVSLKPAIMRPSLCRAFAFFSFSQGSSRRTNPGSVTAMTKENQNVSRRSKGHQCRRWLLIANRSSKRLKKPTPVAPVDPLCSVFLSVSFSSGAGLCVFFLLFFSLFSFFFPLLSLDAHLTRSKPLRTGARCEL